MTINDNISDIITIDFSFVLMLREEELVNNIGISLFVNVSTTALTVLVIDRLYRRIEVRKKTA